MLLHRCLPRLPTFLDLCSKSNPTPPHPPAPHLIFSSPPSPLSANPLQSLHNSPLPLPAPPQFVLPTKSPHLSKTFLAPAISPVLWAQHKPDRFDTWSAGITLLCLVLPQLRTHRGLAAFLKEFEKSNYDLDCWRAGCSWVNARDLRLLDDDEGAGWALARALLRPRAVEVAESGHVSFVGGPAGAPQRISAADALRHRSVCVGGCVGEPKRGLRTTITAWCASYMYL